MSGEILTPVGFSGGRYEGALQASRAPDIEALYQGKVVAMASPVPLAGRKNEYRVTLDLPAAVMADGVQVISLRSTISGEVLDHVTLMAGAVLDADIRAELALLRAEFEVLKRAFRRHCIETDQD